MRALNHIQEDHQRKETHNSFPQSLMHRLSKLSEAIWLCITFMLFIVMGPFSVIAVIYGLWALATGESSERMVEPARC